MNNTIFPIEQVPQGLGGGKARGLAQLKKWGFNIPLTFVVIRFDQSELIDFMKGFPDDMVWAVRSSGTMEDGREHSFAGQFTTFLDVRGRVGVVEAVKACFGDRGAERVQAYRSHQGLDTGDDRMFVVLQEMVDVRVSGAVFTVDPVHNRRDRMMIGVTQGSGDALMSGKTDGESLTIYKTGDLPNSRLLDERLLKDIKAQALAIEKAFGAPVDLEYAINQDRQLVWLQMRPVTGLDQVHMNELDSKPLYENPIYTRGNIGEMMPGPVTPLTMSTFGRAIDWGLQVFYKRSGALQEISPENLFIHSFYNHLFMEMNSLYTIAKHVLLATKENIDYSIVGRSVEGPDVHREVSLFKAFRNLQKSYGFIKGAPAAQDKLETLATQLRLDCPDTPGDCYDLIDKNLQSLLDAYMYHYTTSAQSGWYFSAVLSIVSKERGHSVQDNQIASGFFRDIQGIESAQVLASVEHLAGVLAGIDGIGERFLDVPVDQALLFLSDTGPEQVVQAWKEFLARHGHRCVREAELWEKEWAKDPTPIVQTLQSTCRIKINAGENATKNKELNETKPRLNPVKRLILRAILPKARQAVARREKTKALAIQVQYKFKQAYRALSVLLKQSGLLRAEEDVFFLTHQELGKLIRSGETHLSDVAEKRRKLYPQMMELSFDDLYLGIPIPSEHLTSDTTSAGNLQGLPVSRGVAEGRVRIVRSIEDAMRLQSGDIMVAKYTDVGWTPYYSLINGLITEIGSPLSHGAVVAREYGLPTVVGMKHAMDTLKDGQIIRLDAVNGRVKPLR